MLHALDPLLLNCECFSVVVLITKCVCDMGLNISLVEKSCKILQDLSYKILQDFERFSYKILYDLTRIFKILEDLEGFIGSYIILLNPPRSYVFLHESACQLFQNITIRFYLIHSFESIFSQIRLNERIHMHVGKLA